jgi:hypothetical protein
VGHGGLNQGWRTYGTQKDFLHTRHSLLPQFFPDQPSCVVKKKKKYMKA